MLAPPPRYFAHRGGGALVPEYTLAGIRLAARLGYRAVEFDVMLSGSGTPVLIHDETLERTTNGSGAVATTDDATLFALDAGGEPPPRLTQAARLCGELGLLANIEVKPASGYERETAQRVAAQVKAGWPGLPPLFSSFSPVALQVLQAQLPDLPRAWLLAALPDDWRAEARRLGVVALHLDLALVTPGLVRECAGLGLAVRAYTLQTPALADYLFGIGVAGVFVDPLDRFQPQALADRSAIV
jgi:glycerophosphoryl diester phosphodiesterase